MCLSGEALSLFNFADSIRKGTFLAILGRSGNFGMMHISIFQFDRYIRWKYFIGTDTDILLLFKRLIIIFCKSKCNVHPCC